MLPSYITDQLDKFTDVNELLATGLETLKTVVELIAKFIQGVQDLNAAYIEAARLLINSIVQQLTQTGVYALFHVTPSVSYTMTPRQWLSHASASLYDKMDARRPILVDPYAFVGAAVIMATSENLRSLLDNFYNLMELLKNVIGSLDQVRSWKDFGEEFEVVEGVGRVPNWESKKIVDIVPYLDVIVEKLLSYANSILGPSDASSIYSEYIEKLQDKIDYLVNFIKSIEDIVNLIAVILNFEGAFVLPIFGQGDAAWLSGELINSTGGPMDVPDANYTVGGMFLTTGGTTAPMETLFMVLGLESWFTEYRKELGL
jgi:hypothetical protein